MGWRRKGSPFRDWKKRCSFVHLFICCCFYTFFTVLVCFIDTHSAIEYYIMYTSAHFYQGLLYTVHKCSLSSRTAVYVYSTRVLTFIKDCCIQYTSAHFHQGLCMVDRAVEEFRQDITAPFDGFRGHGALGSNHCGRPTILCLAGTRQTHSICGVLLTRQYLRLDILTFTPHQH